MYRALLALSVFVFLGCEADPGLKKIPQGDPRLVKKGVNLNFYPMVDILFVIDDSGSMDDFQRDLARSADKFVGTIFQSQFIDFHIGVTTSNDNESYVGGPFWYAPTWGGRLIDSDGYNYVTRNTPGVFGILRKYLQPGTDGDGDEKFFSMVRDALTEPILSNENAGFYREEAHLLVFFLTDAEDQSEFYGPSDFYDFLLNLKTGDENKIHFAAALQPTNSLCRRGEDPAFKIVEFSQYLNGSVFNICQSGYGEELVKVAHNVLERVSKIPLDEVPKVSTIQVIYGSQTIPHAVGIGWTYNPDENVIYLGKDLVLEEEPPGTQLDVRFETVY